MIGRLLIRFAPLIFILLALSFSLAPDIYRIASAPSNTNYPLIHNNLQDYYYYLSLMRQGYEGNFFLTSRMTPEHFPPVFAQTFFALLGYISKITSISLPMTYFLSRIFLGIGLMIASVAAAKVIYADKKDVIFAQIMVFFGTGFWTITLKNGAVIINQFLTFWTRFNPILRTTYLPHHLLSTIFGLVSLLALASALSRNNFYWLLLASTCGLLAGFIYFATMINILGSMPLALFFLLLFNIKNRFNISKYISILSYIFFYIFISSISLFYVYYLSGTVFPWSAYKKVGENFTFSISFIDYLKSLGPALLLSLIVLPRLLFSQLPISALLFSWGLFPFIGLFLIVHLFPAIGNAYYLEATSYIPLGLLSVYGIKTLASFFPRLKKLPLIAMLLLCLYFLPSIAYSQYVEFLAFPFNRYNIFIPEKVIEAVSWLEKNTPYQSVVLSGGYFGTIIPAFSHNRVVFGHPANTYDSWHKNQQINQFFSQTDTDVAAAILKQYQVAYVFYSLDTDWPKADFISKLNLRKIYENEKAAIYKTADK